MVSELSFWCNKCGKQFVFKGHWYNQALLEWWSEVRRVLHCIIKHPAKPSKKKVLYILKLIIVLIPLLILQILDIIATPFRLL